MTTCLRLCHLSEHYNHLTGTKLSLQPARQHCKLTRQAPALLDFLGWLWYFQIFPFGILCLREVIVNCSWSFPKSSSNPKLKSVSKIPDDRVTSWQRSAPEWQVVSPKPCNDLVLCDVKCVKCCNDSKLQEAVTRPCLVSVANCYPLLPLAESGGRLSDIVS